MILTSIENENQVQIIESRVGPRGPRGGNFQAYISIPGPFDPDTFILRVPMGFSVTFPNSLPESVAVARVPSTSSVVFRMFKTVGNIQTQIGTITFAPGSTIGTYSMVSSVSFGSTDVFSIQAPTVSDATLADVGFTIIGERN